MKKSKKPNLSNSKIYVLIFTLLFCSIFYFLFINKKFSTTKYPHNQLSQTDTENYSDEILNIDSWDNPALGLAGFSSGYLIVNNKEISMRLLAPDREKIILNNFPCEEGKEVIAVKGNFRVIALEDVSSTQALDINNIGEQFFVMDPPEIEQSSVFAKKVLLSRNPTYEAFTLAFRVSCNDTKVSFFTYNDVTKKVEKIKFYKKDGQISDFIMIPKGLRIPQIDDNNNIIASAYNNETKWRDKTRYKFNPSSFGYEEIETYSQPK